MDTRVKPAYDTELEIRRNFHPKGLYLVFRALQNARADAVAGQFLDRPRRARSDSAGHAICFPGPQAHGGCRAVARNMRIFAAWKLGALSPRVAISAVGCRARRAGRHGRPRRLDRGRSLRRAWRSG